MAMKMTPRGKTVSLILRRTLAATFCTVAAGAAMAQPAERTLTIAAMTSPSALDPHFHSTNNNNMALFQIFEPLIREANDGSLIPALAESWKVVGDTTWEIKLRANARFHDGTPFEAEDIAFTLDRLGKVPNSPGPFTPYARSIKEVEIVDPTTIRVHTHYPNPYLDYDLTRVMILSRKIHAEATTAQFTSGRLAVGTGPYRYVGFTLNERLSIAANPDYWGPKPEWARVETRYVTNAGARTAALLAGEVDLIDGVPVHDVTRLQREPNVKIFGTDSYGTAYLFPDAVREQAPFITDKQGRPLPSNPLRDRRVREALSMAINRAGIVERLLVGQGTPAEQFAPPAVGDRAPDMPPLALDIAAARKLLADAGYPNGFRLTIHGPNGFFASDGEVLQAIAQGFNRIGIDTAVEILPPANFFTRATNRDFAMFLTTYTANLASNTLRQVAATRDPATGSGPFNRQHYTNPTMDAPLTEALRTMDPTRRQQLTTQAMQELIRDKGIIPVFYLRVNWAGRSDRLTYEPSPNWYTQAQFAHPIAP
ncbi:ABC transporter, substrate-binding protein, family 5 [Acetobacteraceae bacterium AT-5844]|nr:ABC transporter, substrate-binding protein, family 5 [Acetobacteraceae bacterium AT-5844]